MCSLIPRSTPGEKGRSATSTPLKKLEIIHHWVLADFIHLMEFSKENSEVISEVFSQREYSWDLKMFPNTRGNKVSLFLILKNNGSVLEPWKNGIKIDLYVSPVCARRTISHSLSKVFRPGDAYGWIPYMEHSYIYAEKEKLLPDNNLTLYCALTVYYEEDVGPGYNADHIIEYPLQNDLRTLLKDRTFTDFILSVKEKQIKVHRFVLAARSPVFKAILEQNTRENNEGVVNIIDFNPETIAEMVNFMYTGRVSNWRNITIELLVAARKYALLDLKTLCENALISQMNLGNVLDLLETAYHYNIQTMKECVIRFISSYSVQIFASSKWKSLNPSQCRLIADVFREIFAAYSTIQLINWNP